LGKIIAKFADLGSKKAIKFRFLEKLHDLKENLDWEEPFYRSLLYKHKNH
jgi:hypothetical protein